MEKRKPLNVAFIHGRPTGHPTHAKYAKSVNSTFFHEDKYVRWQDLQTNKLKRYFSWLVNALLFPQLTKWDVILTECVRIPQLIQKKLGLLKKRQKLIALMSDESLYFTSSKKFPRLTRFLMIQFWKSCDAIICIGDFQQELAQKLLPNNHHSKIKTIFNGIHKDQIQELGKITPRLDSNTIAFIGNASSIWRTEYKGLDIMIEVLSECMDEIDLTFKIAGNIPKEIQSYLTRSLSPEKKKNIHFLGQTEHLGSLLQEASLYLHTARGEAWGISITEAIAAGVPAIISSETGSKEVINQIQPDFVVQLDKQKIKETVLRYLNTPLPQKQKISEQGRLVVKKYTEEEAIENFASTFHQLLEELQ